MKKSPAPKKSSPLKLKSQPYPSVLPKSRPTPKFPSVATRAAHRGPEHAAKDELLPFPAPEGNAKMTLESFFGSDAIRQITQAGQLIFHFVGDTGRGTAAQESVAQAMARDINNDNYVLGPSFMINAGDVLYGPNKQAHYPDRFYRMYSDYNRLIFAVPGNHDGEILPGTDPTTLAAFIENFCAAPGTQPALAKQFGVLAPNQPGVYWHLEAPFVDILGLYSNKAEDFGMISDPVIGTQQIDWLKERLTTIAQARKSGRRKAALLIVVHHPPYARGFQESGFGHPGSPKMLADIDACCAAASILPAAVLSGHTHNHQRYMRTQTLGNETWTIPYIIAGTGGISIQKIPAPRGVQKDGVLYASAHQNYGYVTVSVSATQLTLAFTEADETHRNIQEQVTMDLRTHTQI